MSRQSHLEPDQKYVKMGSWSTMSLAKPLEEKQCAWKGPGPESAFLTRRPGRATWSEKCFKMSLAEALGARNASRYLWQSHLEQDVFGVATSSVSGARNTFEMCLWRRHFESLAEQETLEMSLAETLDMLEDVSGRATWSKKCFKISLVEPLGARKASRCLWQSRLKMLQDVSAGV